MRRKLIIGVIFLVIVAGASFFSPYNPILELSEKYAIKSFISSDNTFKGLEIVDIDYKGSDTYFIQTQDGDSVKNYIVMRYNSSIMNGHWKVFEETSKEKYF